MVDSKLACSFLAFYVFVAASVSQCASDTATEPTICLTMEPCLQAGERPACFVINVVSWFQLTTARAKIRALQMGENFLKRWERCQCLCRQSQLSDQSVKTVRCFDRLLADCIQLRTKFNEKMFSTMLNYFCRSQCSYARVCLCMRARICLCLCISVRAHACLR